MATDKAQAMAASARDRLHGFWNSFQATHQQNKADGGGLENVVRIVFGSCTSVVDLGSGGERPSVFESTPAGDTANQFLFDEQLRAEQAVHTLREERKSPAVRKKKKSPVRTKSAVIPKPFHIASPSQRAVTVPRVLNDIPPPPPPSAEIAMNPSASFDDGISAISAHTLEEMVQNQAKRRQDTSLNTTLTSVDSSPRPTPASPFALWRGRSHGTWGSKNTKSSRGTKGTRGTKSSRGTKSTLSTNTSGFSSVFRKDEAQYWKNEVQRDLQDTSPRRKRDSTTSKHDATITTAASSFHSSGAFDKHPHETFHFEASDLLSDEVRVVHDGFLHSSDPDRLGEVLVLPPGTEMAEI